ncbi:MAG: ATP-binding cassette domain-containing protein [Rhodobacteraceae bacterium]|nr:ATP-binding cassette domain-containing protein [Paracoccaceae bacterium]
MSDPVLSCRGISKSFRVGAHTVQAVREFSVDVAAGECLAIVGESGSGKSTVANMILGVIPPSDGEIRYKGEALPARRKLRHRKAMQLVQQNPLSSLNSSRSVGASIRLALDVHKIGSRGSRTERVGELLSEVGLAPNLAGRPPRALSGGQMQRVAIARARACDSELIVLDEPTSALDVIVQARILRLLNDLRRSRGLTYVFITHDLAVVRNVAHRVVVMCEGSLVEMATTKEIFSNPRHQYTRSLIAASPVVTKEEQMLREQLRANVPDRD